METWLPCLIPAEQQLLRSWKAEHWRSGNGAWEVGSKWQRCISIGGTAGLDVLGIADLMEMRSLKDRCWTCLRAFLASGTSVARDDKSWAGGDNVQRSELSKGRFCTRYWHQWMENLMWRLSAWLWGSTYDWWIVVFSPDWCCGPFPK